MSLPLFVLLLSFEKGLFLAFPFWTKMYKLLTFLKIACRHLKNRTCGWRKCDPVAENSSSSWWITVQRIIMREPTLMQHFHNPEQSCQCCDLSQRQAVWLAPSWYIKNEFKNSKKWRVVILGQNVCFRFPFGWSAWAPCVRGPLGLCP